MKSDHFDITKTFREFLDNHNIDVQMDRHIYQLDRSMEAIGSLRNARDISSNTLSLV